jgi:hypothetical protein
MGHSIGEFVDWLGGPGGSLWAIRGAMACLAVGYTLQIATGVRNTRDIAALWLLGALLATIHTATAISAFHAGSFAEALESTARRTDGLFGVRVGWGVYVNYVFVAAWWLDAFWRWRLRSASLHAVEIGIDFFLISIAFFGAVVFAAGPIRYAGMAFIAIWVILWFRRYATKPTATEY